MEGNHAGHVMAARRFFSREFDKAGQEGRTVKLVALWRYYLASRCVNEAFEERDAFGRWAEACCKTWLRIEWERVQEHLTRLQAGEREPCGCLPMAVRADLARLLAERDILLMEFRRRGLRVSPRARSTRVP